MKREALEQKIRTQDGLLQISQAVQKMARPRDLERVMQVCLGEANRMGLDVCTMALHLMVDPEQDMIETFRVGSEGTITFGERRKGIYLTQWWKTGKKVYTQDVETDPKGASGIRRRFVGIQIRSFVDVPFSQGVISAHSTEPNAFSEADEEILVQIAEIFSSGISRMRELEQLEERVRLGNAYRDIAQMTLSSLNLDGVLDNLGVHITQAGIFRSLSISLVDQEANQVEIVRSFRRQEDGTVVESETGGAGVRYSLDSTDPIAEVACTGKMLVIVEYDERFSIKNPPEFYAGQAFYFCPAKKGEKVIAILATGSTLDEKEETLKKIEAMQSLLDLVVIAIENARLYEYAQQEIRERKEREQDLIKLQRLRAIGELSAGVSHNLNNMLTGVLGPAQLLQMKTNDPDILEEVDDILIAATRAKDLVHRLYQSTHQGSHTEPESVDGEEIVTQAIQQTRPRWKDESEARGITIEVETCMTGVPPIRATQSEISDIFVNFMLNAVDAMPEGGKITIGTEMVDEEVVLVFTDTGIGMDEETKKKIFEPFFTTKAEVGVGLGLSTVYNSVMHWGGRIDVDSEVGKGTTFRIYLPVWSEPKKRENTGKVQTWRSGKILVVEDDEPTQKVLSELLSRHHEVDIRPDGKSTLSTFNPGQYHVALIDLGLPKMPGDQIAKQIRSLDPDISLVLITGWNLEASDPRRSVFDFMLQKPFGNVNNLYELTDQAIRLYDTRRSASQTRY